YPRQDRSAPRLTPSVYCSLDSRLRNESGTPSPLDDGCLSYSPGSTQVHRHEVLALRFQSLSSVTFEGCLHSVARTRQARLVVPPEPFDAIFCKRVFRVLLQLPTRDQVLTAFVYFQLNGQPCTTAIVPGRSPKPGVGSGKVLVHKNERDCKKPQTADRL